MQQKHIEINRILCGVLCKGRRKKNPKKLPSLRSLPKYSLSVPSENHTPMGTDYLPYNNQLALLE